MAEPHAVLALVLATSMAAGPGAHTLPVLESERAGLPGLVELRAEEEPGRARVPEPKPKAKDASASAAETTTSAKPVASGAVPQRAAKRAERATASEEEDDDTAVPEREHHVRVAPVLALAVAIGAGIVGGVYVGKTMTAIDALPANVTNANVIRDQQREVMTNGIIATISLSGAVAALVSGLVLLGS